MAKTSTTPLLRLAPTPAPVRQQIVDALRLSLEDGRFAPGERLVERDLCEQLGVSRPSLREALRELESDGLVTSLANRGVIVSVISVRAAREIYEMRTHLEGMIAGRFAQHASSAQMARFEDAVQRLLAAYEAQSGLVAAKRDFYATLMDGADHELAASMLRSIQLRASQLRLLTLSDPDRMRQSMAEMRTLLKAIRKRDAEAATLAAQRHVQNAGALALRLLERDAVPRAAARA